MSILWFILNSHTVQFRTRYIISGFMYVNLYSLKHNTKIFVSILCLITLKTGIYIQNERTNLVRRRKTVSFDLRQHPTMTDNQDTRTRMFCCYLLNRSYSTLTYSLTALTSTCCGFDPRQQDKQGSLFFNVILRIYMAYPVRII